MLRFLSQTETPPGWLRQWTLATGDPPLLLRTFRGSPVCSYEASWRFLSFLCLSFSEINLGNTFYSFSFRQTLKHMVLWVRPLLGTYAWHPRCFGDGGTGSRGGRLFSTKKNSETNPWAMPSARVLLLFSPLLWAPGAYQPCPTFTLCTVFIFSISFYLVSEIDPI